MSKVNVDLVPIEDIGSLWIITGEESEVNRDLVYMNSIYQNTIIKTGKSKEVSPFLKGKNPKMKIEEEAEKKIDMSRCTHTTRGQNQNVSIACASQHLTTLKQH